MSEYRTLGTTVPVASLFDVAAWRRNYAWGIPLVGDAAFTPKQQLIEACDRAGEQRAQIEQLVAAIPDSVILHHLRAAQNGKAPHRTESKSNAASPSRRVVRVVFDSLHRLARNRSAMECTAIQSNAARPFNEWLCRGAFLSAQCNAGQRNARQRTASQLKVTR